MRIEFSRRWATRTRSLPEIVVDGRGVVREEIRAVISRGIVKSSFGSYEPTAGGDHTCL